MHDGRLQHRLTLVVVVLAVWTSGVVASADPQRGVTQEWLFSLSIEELMELPVDLMDGRCRCGEDLWERPGSSTAVGGVPHRGAKGCTLRDENRTSLTSITREDTDNGRYQE